MLMIKEKVASSTWVVMLALQKWLQSGEQKLKAVGATPKSVAPIVGVALASQAVASSR